MSRGIRLRGDDEPWVEPQPAAAVQLTVPSDWARHVGQDLVDRLVRDLRPRAPVHPNCRCVALSDDDGVCWPAQLPHLR